MRCSVFIAVFTMLLCLPINIFAEISEAQVRQAIKVLIKDPNSSAGQKAGRVVLEFADASLDHQIRISLSYLPWADSRNLPEGSQMLVAAFVAGNLQEQIRKRSSKPEPYAGALAVIKVYQKMSEKRSAFRIPKVEKFIAMEKQGILRAHIESVSP